MSRRSVRRPASQPDRAHGRARRRARAKGTKRCHAFLLPGATASSPPIAPGAAESPSARLGSRRMFLICSHVKRGRAPEAEAAAIPSPFGRFRTSFPEAGDRGIADDCGRGGTVDAGDLKSPAPRGVRVRLPPSAPPPQAASAFSAVHSQRARLIGSRNMPPIRTPICQRTWAWTGPMPGMSSET